MTEYTNVICGIGLPDDDRKKQEKDSIDITIGIFFDGTCNNKYNIASKLGTTMEKKYRDEASYHGSFTNVANLYEAYSAKQEEYQAKIYVEGIGTEEPVEDETGNLVSSGKGDVRPGYAFGRGRTGINGKIERGCKLIVDKISKIKKLIQADEVTIGKLTLDVFGFSRGAAAARSFVTRIEKAPEDGIKDVNKLLFSISRYEDPQLYERDKKRMEEIVSERRKVNLRKFLTDSGIEIAKIEVRFLGLFDTVPSFDPEDTLFHSFSNDTRELGLDIPETVKAVVHLVAADEYRENFALTDTSSCPKALELILPGAHSDIGGGYNAIETEELCNGYYFTGQEMYRGYMTLDELKEGWWIPFDSEREELSMTGRSYKVLAIRQRKVRNDYAKIPLDLMGTLAMKNKEIQFKKETYDNIVEIGTIHSFTLQSVKDLIMSMPSRGNILYKMETSPGSGHKQIVPVWDEYGERTVKGIRMDYIHLSAHDKASYRFLYPHKAAKGNKRIIYNG